MGEKIEVGCARPIGGPISDDTEKPKQEQEVSEKEGKSMIQVGKPAPDFTAPAYHKGEFVNVKLSDYKGKWVIFFSHPADFTPVCTTEFMTFASMADDFKKRNCELIGLSIDSVFSHIAWLRTIKERIEFKGMKDVAVTFPVIADVTMDVATKYGMLQPGASKTEAVRAIFVIDPEAKVRVILY